MSELQKYISKRIRILRTQSGMTQEQLEEKADLGFAPDSSFPINLC